MPTKNNNPSGGGRRKRPPSHQNKFAFRHNPKSKLTDKILASPNVGCCQRCYDKIEWRKKYRKYKPRTQPGTCNGCRKRNVKAAYHTVCAKCSWDLSTLTVRDSSKEGEGDGDGTDVPVTSIGDGGGVIVVDAGQRMEEEENVADGPTTTNDVDPSISNSSVAANKKEGKTEEEAKKNMRKIRMCAVCTKEPALGAKAERGDDEGDDTTTYGPRLKLRERRALERQQQKEMEDKDCSKKNRKKDGGNGGESADEEDVLDDAESMDDESMEE